MTLLTGWAVRIEFSISLGYAPTICASTELPAERRARRSAPCVSAAGLPFIVFALACQVNTVETMATACHSPVARTHPNLQSFQKSQGDLSCSLPFISAFIRFSWHYAV